eukprot:CAMPEP_0119341316 /NCGR_PEP_ID=MMETSP1333-20130426/102067_1 /TAXON_ID=418940 /ORGANISM="Scyphosphaera apsteinii, Strain RCC1455" /LENGTH=44 /DNA_ID= /DNA_START= /DNA_END= /DNA_ORIENTATION=
MEATCRQRNAEVSRRTSCPIRQDTADHPHLWHVCRLRPTSTVLV